MAKDAELSKLASSKAFLRWQCAITLGVVERSDRLYDADWYEQSVAKHPKLVGIGTSSQQSTFTVEDYDLGTEDSWAIRAIMARNGLSPRLAAYVRIVWYPSNAPARIVEFRSDPKASARIEYERIGEAAHGFLPTPTEVCVADKGLVRRAAWEAAWNVCSSVDETKAVSSLDSEFGVAFLEVSRPSGIQRQLLVEPSKCFLVLQKIMPRVD